MIAKVESTDFSHVYISGSEELSFPRRSNGELQEVVTNYGERNGIGKEITMLYSAVRQYLFLLTRESDSKDQMLLGDQR